MARHVSHGHSRGEVVGEAEVRRLLSRCWRGALVTTPAVAALARLEDDPLPVVGAEGGQLVVDAEAVTAWAARVLEERPFLVEQAGRAMRGDWHLAVRGGGVDATPVTLEPAAPAAPAGGSPPSPSPEPSATLAPRRERRAPRPEGVDSGSRWLRGWDRILRFVNEHEPMELEALRKWARHPLRPLPVVWAGGREVGGKRLGARAFAERAKVLAWLRQRQRVATRRVAA